MAGAGISLFWPGPGSGRYGISAGIDRDFRKKDIKKWHDMMIFKSLKNAPWSLFLNSERDIRIVKYVLCEYVYSRVNFCNSIFVQCT